MSKELSQVQIGDKVRVTRMSDLAIEMGISEVLGKVFTVLRIDNDGDIWIDAPNNGALAIQTGTICIQFSKGWNCELVENGE